MKNKKLMIGLGLVVLVLLGVMVFGSFSAGDAEGNLRGTMDEAPRHSQVGSEGESIRHMSELGNNPEGHGFVEVSKLGEGEVMDGSDEGGDNYDAAETWAQCRERCNNSYPEGSLGRTNGRWDTCHQVCDRVHSPGGDLNGKDEGGGNDQMETE